MQLLQTRQNTQTEGHGSATCDPRNTRWEHRCRYSDLGGGAGFQVKGKAKSIFQNVKIQGLKKTRHIFVYFYYTSSG